MNNNIPASIALAKSGYSLQEVLAALTNRWDLSIDEQRAYKVHTYYVRRWKATYVRNGIDDGIITHDGIPYCVIYRSCTPASLKNVDEVKISFRAGDYGNFALVQPTPSDAKLLPELTKKEV
jgi:hypothetical protein